MRKWPTVSLGEVVTPAQRAEAPQPGTTYRQIGVKLWGEGAYERETVDGSQTKYAQLFRAEAGDIIVNKIWARNGSVAVVSENLAGCFGSGEFPMFAPIADRLESRWMHWLTKTRGFWAQCDEKSRGTSGKNRIKPEQFLSVEIPLPPLAEQRRVVARIEELAAQIHETRTLRHQAAEEAEALLESSVGSRFSSLPKHSTRKLETLATKIGSGSTPAGGRTAYPSSGIPFIRSLNVRMRQFQWEDIAFISDEMHKSMSGTRVRPRDVLLNITGASIGRVACAPDDIDEANVNQHVAIIRPIEEL
ncbi:MAG TPA: restriction endonuclease subunit S, partial [Verrucomicrobiae bacterium]|nr:restriction endonuclease subunit S [Verrucomicrobiae bacterium]